MGLNPWLAAHIRWHLCRLDASICSCQVYFYILDMSMHVATDSVTMTHSLICIHASQIANDYVIVTIPFFFLCMIIDVHVTMVGKGLTQLKMGSYSSTMMCRLEQVIVCHQITKCDTFLMKNNPSEMVCVT